MTSNDNTINIENIESEIQESKIKLRALIVFKRNELDKQGKKLDTEDALLESQLFYFLHKKD
jgi:hypothetical protein